jgi:8-oxo-dGTP diphosphatase
MSNPYSGKVRIRICGVLIEDQKILLVKHRGLGSTGIFWSPPGGGSEFGEPWQQTLIREFEEETGLKIEVGEFLSFHEHIDPEFHAMELFFLVKRTGGKLQRGSEPESAMSGPKIEDLSWFSATELKHIPEACYHSRCLLFLGEH